MFKALFIGMLLLALGGCATPAAQPSNHGALLNFADLAAEITVHHEVTESTASIQQDTDKESTASIQQDTDKNSTD